PRNPTATLLLAHCQWRRKAGQPGRNIGNIGGRQGGSHGAHDRILANVGSCRSTRSTALVSAYRMPKKIFMLASQNGIRRHDGSLAISAMARSTVKLFVCGFSC